MTLVPPSKQLNNAEQKNDLNINKTDNNDKIVVFDWDDTLCPTTYYLKNTNQENFEGLTIFSELVLKILKMYLSIYGKGRIFIVTNAGQNCVLYSLKLLIDICKTHNIKNSFDDISHFLINGNIPIISAQYMYSKMYPKQTKLWKMLVFQNIILSTNSSINAFISIGDSLDEFQAAETVINLINNEENNYILLHRVKLVRKPAISELNEQLSLIINLAMAFNQETKNTIIDYAALKRNFLHNHNNHNHINQAPS